ncbi:MAG: methyltransferase domain-containing protein [Thermoanaerobaculales bacterium]|nr:methyltransferase domain-containing protein [Thermoanaerobaculales bacterium]
MSQGQRLAVLLERVSGIVFPEREIPRLTMLGEERARINGFADLTSYVQALYRDSESAEWRELLSLVTVKESSLFRGARQFEVLVQNIIPKLLARGRRTIRIWSAGCARGEEPATLAVVLSECDKLRPGGWEVLGTDVDESALDVARRAIFSKRSVRKVPQPLLDRYFVPSGEQFELAQGLRANIRYRFLNLVSTPYVDLEPGPLFDVIFLRNVLIYFREKSQVRVLAEMAQMLAPDGALFVGPSESLWQISPQFLTEDHHGCFVHRVRMPSIPQPSGIPSAEFATPHPSGLSRREAVGTQAIGQDIELDVFKRSPRDLALQAVKRADFDGAAEILALDSGGEEDPIIYALKGVLAERDGRHEDALRAFRAASYLDSRLFQVRFMMASCLEGSGWVKRAQAEYRAIFSLLKSGLESELPSAELLALPTRLEVEEYCRQTL